MTGKIHSFESFGTVDGPGTRFVIFMQGCPMRCKYCHNPDTWNLNGGKEYSAQEVAQTVLKYKSYLSRGGVTVSGGEPLLQIQFVTELFSILKEYGMHTAVDTSGITFDKDDKQSVALHEKLLEVTDLVLLDIKHIDDTEHKKLTGFSNSHALDFARFLSDNGTPVWIRHVLVDGITDNDEYLKSLKQFIDTLKNVQTVEVLPYHGMGETKYKKLGIRYALEGMKPPSAERIANARKILTR
ncbi:MAG: pyruvate formate lyase-activating protein [Clostridia bacterium]|nr:pyruvate formate lyase-activating protein [Clostridia bacterium]